MISLNRLLNRVYWWWLLDIRDRGRNSYVVRLLATDAVSDRAFDYLVQNTLPFQSDAEGQVQLAFPTWSTSEALAYIEDRLLHLAKTRGNRLKQLLDLPETHVTGEGGVQRAYCVVPTFFSLSSGTSERVRAARQVLLHPQCDKRPSASLLTHPQPSKEVVTELLPFLVEIEYYTGAAWLLVWRSSGGNDNRSIVWDNRTLAVAETARTLRPAGHEVPTTYHVTTQLTLTWTGSALDLQETVTGILAAIPTPPPR